MKPFQKREPLYYKLSQKLFFFCKDYFVAIIFWWQICFWQNLYWHFFLHAIFFDKIFFLAKFYLVKFFSSIPLDCFLSAGWACMLNLSFRSRNFMVEENKRIKLSWFWAGAWLRLTKSQQNLDKVYISLSLAGSVPDCFQHYFLSSFPRIFSLLPIFLISKKLFYESWPFLGQLGCLRFS